MWTGAFAVLFSIWVLALSAFRGSSSFEAYEMTAAEIIRAYFAAALIGGLVLGWARPLTSHRLGATIVGAVVGTVIYTSVAISMSGVQPRAVEAGLVLGVLVGGICGWRWSQR